MKEEMTELEAKKLLLANRIGTSGTQEEFDKAFRIAILALEKQIPMRVENVHVDEYYCPACEAENNCDNGIIGDKFCPECGQALYQRN